MRLILSDLPLQIDMKEKTDVHVVDLSSLKITNCVGCFGCWVKTPGKCVIRDDATKVYPLIAKSDSVIYISHIRYGGYDTIMKTMLERAIPIQKAFIRLHHGETHHVQREVVEKDAVIIAYGVHSKEEQELFTRLVKRNAENMLFRSYQIRFVSQEQVQQAVNEEVSKWGN